MTSVASVAPRTSACQHRRTPHRQDRDGYLSLRSGVVRFKGRHVLRWRTVSSRWNMVGRRSPAGGARSGSTRPGPCLPFHTDHLDFDRQSDQYQQQAPSMSVHARHLHREPVGSVPTGSSLMARLAEQSVDGAAVGQHFRPHVRPPVRADVPHRRRVDRHNAGHDARGTLLQAQAASSRLSRMRTYASSAWASQYGFPGTEASSQNRKLLVPGSPIGQQQVITRP